MPSRSMYFPSNSNLNNKLPKISSNTSIIMDLTEEINSSVNDNTKIIYKINDNIENIINNKITEILNNINNTNINIDKLRITLLDEYGNVLDMNNANYSFCILVKKIYDL